MCDKLKVENIKRAEYSKLLVIVLSLETLILLITQALIYCPGQDHSILITEEGQVMSAGWGADGQTGLGHYDNQDKFALVEGDIKVR